jgi:hypothetical protein
VVDDARHPAARRALELQADLSIAEAAERRIAFLLRRAWHSDGYGLATAGIKAAIHVATGAVRPCVGRTVVRGRRTPGCKAHRRQDGAPHGSESHRASSHAFVLRAKSIQQANLRRRTWINSPDLHVFFGGASLPSATGATSR